MSFTFIVCENFYSDIKAAVHLQKFEEAEVRSYSCRCDSPPATWSEFADSVKNSKSDTVVIIGSYCLRNLTVPTSPEFSRCTLNRQTQCLHLLCSPTLLEALQHNGTYVLSSGWLRHWPKRITTWGFDRSTAINFFGESLQKLLLLDTGTDRDSRKHLADLGEFLQLPTDTLPVGLEYLGLFLSQVIADYQQQKFIRQKKKVERQAADSATTLDLIGMVTKAKSKAEVISSIVELFTMLFAPEKIHFIQVSKEGVHFDRAPVLTAEEVDQVRHFYSQKKRVSILNEEQGTFLLRIGGREETTALLLFSQVAYPQYIHPYINTALAMSEVCALAIEHVQALKELFTTSRLAGKAEVATEVLHNVGNTLNSISVSSEQIREAVQQSSSTGLPGIIPLLQGHGNDLAHFFGHDSKGRMLPLYFAKLSEKLTEERNFLLTETTRQLHHIRRIVEIIRAQQDTAKLASFTEQIDITALLEECLDVFQSDFEKQGVTVERYYDFQQSIKGEPHKILQVVSNLIRNAVESFDETSPAQKKISVRTYSTADQNEVEIILTDNGKGMQQEILQQAFAFGFTTKKDGHGFGLHNAANLAAEMGGSLTGESKGPGQGAQFSMRFPVMATGKTGRTGRTA